MGKSLAELHSAIISSDVTRKSGAGGGCVAREGSGCDVPEAACEWSSALSASGVKRWYRARRANRVSVQSKLEDAAQDEDEQRGGDQQIQRIAHSSPGTGMSVQ
ncbi:hypothetical protein FVF58_16700 [Paraburkholderia panacisoli]|uniref:Uncharacterized protein n=1 Tax=Paraburkholderia panacisoli TaxID=2603818 RepID=A0A5B0H762_9BURK|nr:hypothetical protein [Paraburkholderia panacisoli]KAA1011035.1 hypothetical protein FVF58_16700 [Paraburkholderia panacisoli]